MPLHARALSLTRSWQCEQLPAAVTELQWELKLEYVREMEIWQKTVDEWDNERKTQQEEQWAQLETPTERAGHDLTRFLEHYYLTDGVPDPAKKPEPLALYNFTDEEVIGELRERAAQIPGLEIVSAGRGPDRAICIGWNRASVYSLAGEIENVARENQKKRIEAEWEAAMQNHKRFANSSASAPQAPDAAKSAKQATPTALQLACGSFILQCQAVADKQADLPDADITKLTLDIADIPATRVETVRASVDLGVFSGTALLSFSQEILEWFVKRYDKTAFDAAEQAVQYAARLTQGEKRKAEAYPEEEAQRPRKQPKVQESKPGRIFVRMRGEADGKICPDVQHGYLDFLDTAWTKFKGVFDIPGVGENIEVEGFRVAQEAAMDPPPWKAYWPSNLHPAVSAKFRTS